MVTCTVVSLVILHGWNNVSNRCLHHEFLLTMSCQPALQTKCDHRARSHVMAKTFASFTAELRGQDAWQHNALNHSFHHIAILSMSCFFAYKFLLAVVTNTRGRKGRILSNQVACSLYPTSRTICTGSHHGSKSALIYLYNI
jgi:hypothetical protein